MINKTKLDHLVVGAQTLSQGVEYIQKTLGVDIPHGGEHIRMGTHNLLMRLGDNTFFEVIAIHPDIPCPSVPRWFGLDDPFIRQQLKRSPALLTWVVNTRDIQTLLANADCSFGRPQKIGRDNLSWLFGLPRDGRLLAGGMLPYIIQWQTTSHPSTRMTDRGCRLKHLKLFHPHPNWIKTLLVSIHADHLVTLHPLAENNSPYLEATLDTPAGIKTLKSL